MKCQYCYMDREGLPHTAEACLFRIREQRDGLRVAIKELVEGVERFGVPSVSRQIRRAKEALQNAQH